jgi:hypothetical protein
MTIEFDVDKYRINRITNLHDFLDKEREARNRIKKKYVKLLNISLGIEFFLILLELGTVGSSIALPAIIPFSVPISIGLTSCSIILKSSNMIVMQKINKHLEIESLARAKFNSIQEKFTRAIEDSRITAEEFNDIEREMENYENMKSSIINKHNNERIKVWSKLKKRLQKKSTTTVSSSPLSSSSSSSTTTTTNGRPTT